MTNQFLALVNTFTKEELRELIYNLVEKEQIGQAAMEAVVADRPIPNH